jgi:BTB/POZ domain
LIITISAMPDTRATKRARVEKEPSPAEATDDVTMVDTEETIGKEEEASEAVGEDDEELPERCDLVWYDDGNIILQADTMQFRVHKSILSQHSTVLRDMFKAPQPLPTPENTLDRCRIFKMEGDSDYHWENLLQLLYDGQR